jgi:uncharacterized protein
VLSGSTGSKRDRAGGAEESMSGRHETAGRRGGSFDAFDVAFRRASITGKVDATSLARLAEVLAPETGAALVSWRIAGAEDATGRPALEIGLDGVVPLVCQRCLKAFDWPVLQRTMLLLARDERELAQLDAEDEHEVMLAATPIDTATLVEDELLLTLPFAPRCERAECTKSAMATIGAAETQAAPSAFAALAGLKSKAAKKGKS